FYQFRIYVPDLQRWLTEDPIGIVGGNNVKQFVGNNPIGFADALGFEITRFSAPPNGEYVPGPLEYLHGESLGEQVQVGFMNIIPTAGNSAALVASGLANFVHSAGDLILGDMGGDFLMTGIPELGA